MPTEPIRVTCGNCKQPASLNDHNCYYCGRPFGDVKLPVEEPPPTQRSPQASVNVRGRMSLSNDQRKRIQTAIEGVLRTFGCELDSLILTEPSGQSNAWAAADGSGPPEAKNPWLQRRPSYYPGSLRVKP